jgi:Holliday junction DNA helicase RuvB
MCRLEYYNPDQLISILTRAAQILHIEIDSYGAAEIAKRSRGTPRVANRLLKRVRDYAQVSGQNIITSNIADKALAMLEVDKFGLDKTDRSILITIITKFNGGPVGLDTLAAAVSEETITVEDVYEPFLLQLGLLNRTPRGRMATKAAYEHLGMVYKGEEQEKFW